jgi:hypothetical protein
MSVTSCLLTSPPQKSDKMPFGLDLPDIKGKDYDYGTLIGWDSVWVDSI